MTKRPTDPPSQTILDGNHTDALGQAIIALSRELWVVTDRLLVLEKLLEERGVTPGAIDAYQPDPDFEAMLQEKREKQLASVLAALGAD